MPEGSSSPARTVALVAATLSTAATLALAVWSVVHLGSGAPPAAVHWLLVAATASAAGAVAWTLWRQGEVAAALADARLEASRLRDLVDGWHWRSDDRHRLIAMHPSASSNDGDALGAPSDGGMLWDHLRLDAADASMLRGRMESGARIDGLRIWRTPEGRERQPVDLCAVPLLDHRGSRIGYVGTLRTRDAEVAHDREHRLLETLLAALPWPVFVLSGGPGGPQRVERGNGAAAQWLGVEPGRLAGLSIDDWRTRLPTELREPVAQALARKDTDAEPLAGGDWTVQSRRHAEGPDGNPQGWVLMLVPQVRGPAAPSDAVAEQESFSYTVSHDLRAPIRVVEGFTKILKEDYGRQLDRIGVDHLDRVLGAAARMNSMIDALLALSQLSTRPLSRQPVNLSQLANYVVEDLRRQSPERAVSVHIEPGLQTQGDPTLLRVVLENLIGNAWKYSARKANARIWFERGVHDGRPIYTVRDNGAGFDMRFADRLFGVFQRLHSASDFAGTGVGLASVRRIIGRHGGEIWAESAVDQGSSFHFTLPGGSSGG